MNNWKRKWREELNTVMPSLSESVLSYPIPEKSEEENTQVRKPFAFGSKFYAISAAIFAIILTVCLTLVFTLKNPTQVTPIATSYAAVIEINPKAMFSVDRSGKVTAVIALNEDADVILSSEERVKGLKGLDVEKAIEKFVEYSAKLGFLDVSGKDAIKVSHTGSKNDSEKIVSAMQNYFKTNGIYSVVFAEQVTPQKVGELASLGDISDSEDVVEKISSLPELYSVRQAEDKEIGELQDMYKETVIDDSMNEVVITRFEKGLKMDEDIKNIDSINKNIMAHEDNPLKEYQDFSNYWWIKDKFKGDYSSFTEDFKNLMISMDSALATYKSNHDKEINSYSEFLLTYTFIQMIDFESMKQLYESMSQSEYLKYFPSIKGFLSALGEDISIIENYLEVPETKEEYLDKKNGYLSDKYDRLEKENEDNFTSERGEISEDDYDSFIDEIIEEYGSIENYWKSF